MSDLLTLMRLVSTQVTAVKPLCMYVHALVVDADLVEVVPLLMANSPLAMASVYRGYGNGYCYDFQHMARARNLGKASI